MVAAATIISCVCFEAVATHSGDLVRQDLLLYSNSIVLVAVLVIACWKAVGVGVCQRSSLCYQKEVSGHFFFLLVDYQLFVPC